MNGDDRPNPDLLLQAVQREEEKRSRGRLKVFLGMAPGVGKTYAMLSAAQELLARRVDVVAGVVETHGRAETGALLAGIPALPRRSTSYRGVELSEMDLDALLSRHPAIALVDEIAHSNVPGSRHTKRYQDVFELLSAGIDVFATLNIQHLESRAGTVREITGVRVTETVPDSVIDLADEVVLVDLAPEELLHRLTEGKVYIPERADQAREHFFQPANLTALRELSLRLVAERVNQELRDYQQVQHLPGGWKTRYRFMVGLYASPYSEQLIRWTRRMAAALDAPWYGAYVETDQPLSDQERQLLSRHFALAKELGGEIIETLDDDPVAGLLRLARENQVTQLVIGKSRRSRWHNLQRGGAVTDRLLRESGDIDIYVVSGEQEPPTVNLKELKSAARPTTPWHGLVAAIFVPAGLGLLGLMLGPLLAYRAIGLLLLLGVSLLGMFVSRRETLLAAFLSAMIWDFAFIPPRFTFSISSTEDYLMFGTFIAVAVIIGHLTTRTRDSERHLRTREVRSNALYQLTRDITSAASTPEALDRAVEHLGRVFEAEVAVLVRRPDGGLDYHPGSTLALDENERGVAEWVALNNRPAGMYTGTLASASAFYLPLVASEKPVGVLGIRPRNPKAVWPDFATLAETFARQLAVAIERSQLNELAHRTRLAQDAEKLYKSILNSVSHELKTPLATIEGSASALLDPAVAGSAAAVGEIAGEIQDASQRLDRLVKNLLDMTRLEAGAIPLRREPADIRDLVSTSLRRLEKELRDHPLTLSIPDDLPPVSFDFLLMGQALVNVLHNAAVHTPPGTPVSLAVKTEPGMMVIEVRDRGPGLPAENPGRVFEKFWRADPHKAGGTGLGLAIARGWVNVHGGTITAENHPEGGALFTIKLPLEVRSDGTTPARHPGD